MLSVTFKTIFGKNWFGFWMLSMNIMRQKFATSKFRYVLRVVYKRKK